MKYEICFKRKLEFNIDCWCSKIGDKMLKRETVLTNLIVNYTCHVYTYFSDLPINQFELSNGILSKKAPSK